MYRYTAITFGSRLLAQRDKQSAALPQVCTSLDTFIATGQGCVSFLEGQLPLFFYCYRGVGGGVSHRRSWLQSSGENRSRFEAVVTQDALEKKAWLEGLKPDIQKQNDAFRWPFFLLRNDFGPARSDGFHVFYWTTVILPGCLCIIWHWWRESLWPFVPNLKFDRKARAEYKTSFLLKTFESPWPAFLGGLQPVWSVAGFPCLRRDHFFSSCRWWSGLRSLWSRQQDKSDFLAYPDYPSIEWHQKWQKHFWRLNGSSNTAVKQTGFRSNTTIETSLMDKRRRPSAGVGFVSPGCVSAWPKTTLRGQEQSFYRVFSWTLARGSSTAGLLQHVFLFDRYRMFVSCQNPQVWLIFLNKYQRKMRCLPQCIWKNKKWIRKLRNLRYLEISLDEKLCQGRKTSSESQCWVHRRALRLEFKSKKLEEKKLGKAWKSRIFSR